MRKYRVVREDSGMYRIDSRDFYLWFKGSVKFPSFESAMSMIDTFHSNEPKHGEVVYEDK